MGIFCSTSCILIMQMTNRVTSVASPYLPHALTSSADPCYAHGDNHPSQHAQYGPQTMPHQGPESEDLGNPALVPNYQQALSPQGYIMVGQSPGQSMQYTSLFYGSGAFFFFLPFIPPWTTIICSSRDTGPGIQWRSRLQQGTISSAGGE
jgi:hypothetical protein